jgi:MinD-like ATPase involved in chromosome partitioning or flagellar assembly
VVTVRGDLAAERPLRVVERALRREPGQRPDGWRDRVVVVPGGHRPGKPDQLQRDRARARLPVNGSHRIVVLGCTRGAGQTTTALLAGDMLASLRAEPVAVLDLNPGRGSLTERAAAIPGLMQDQPPGGQRADSARRPDSGLQVISGAGGADGGDDPGRLFDVVAARYPLTLADPAAGSVPRTLAVADQLLIVAPASAEAANALAMTFEWLEAHGHGRLAASSITVINGVSGPTRSHVEHAANVANGRCRAIVKVPWDSHLRDISQGRGAYYSAPEPDAGVRFPDKADAGLGPAMLAAPIEPQGMALLSPALSQAYTALAGVLISGLAEPGEQRGTELRGSGG